MTDYHNYNTPSQGATDWHTPLNENFKQIDTDVEIRDTDGNLGNYTPKDGAKFFAVDTGDVYVGDGSEWNRMAVSGRKPRYESVSSARVNGRINLKYWKEEYGFGDIGAAWNDAASWLDDNYGGGTIVLPPGGYSIDTRIDWTTDNISCPIRWIGTGADSTSISTNLNDKSIIIGNQSRANPPEIGHMEFNIQGQDSGTYFLLLGDYTQEYSSDASGPAMPYLHDLHIRGGGTVNFYHMQDSFWLRVSRCWMQGAKCSIGESGYNWGNAGAHYNVQYDNPRGDYGLVIQGSANNHQFYRCKMVGGTRSALLGGGGGHMVFHLDQENTGGPVKTDGGTLANTYAHITSVGGVDPGSEDVLINCSGEGLESLPLHGELIGSSWDLLNEWPSSSNGPGGAVKSARQRDLCQIYDSKWRQVNDQSVYQFQGELPATWSNSSSGGGVAPSSVPGGGLALSTGSSAGNTARIDFGGSRFVKFNRYPLTHTEFRISSANDVAVKIGYESADGIQRILRYDSSADSAWSWHEDGVDTQSVGVSPSTNTETEMIMGMLTGEASGEENMFGGRVADESNSGKGRIRFADSSNDWEPFVSIETLTNTNKTLTVSGWGYAQRNTTGLGP